MYQRARVGIGYLPQEASVFRGLTVEENILAPLELNKSLTRKERYKRVEELMNYFSIVHIRKSKGKVLSGGERRRVELARLLAISPKFILLDEPFAGVDPLAVMEIQSLIYQLKQSNIGVLITDHNVNETLSITDNSYLIFNGKVLMHGTPEELVANEDVKNLYLGSNFVLNKKRINL
jgi:lipopolysaccharide export system ATP-binding protein